jgi:hypothetical protein
MFYMSGYNIRLNKKTPHATCKRGAYYGVHKKTKLNPPMLNARGGLLINKSPSPCNMQGRERVMWLSVSLWCIILSASGWWVCHPCCAVIGTLSWWLCHPLCTVVVGVVLHAGPIPAVPPPGIPPAPSPHHHPLPSLILCIFVPSTL